MERGADGAVLEESLLNNLTFVEDNHFWINYKSYAPRVYPFFCREVAFAKTENGYETVDGKVVASVDGYEDLDELFRRSLTVEGEVVYYPILLKEYVLSDLRQPESSFHCDETLTVHYTDGTSQALTPEDYINWVESPNSNSTVTEKEGITVFRMDAFSSTDTRQPRTAMADMGEQAAGIVDLRFNNGGSGSIPQALLTSYVGQTVQSNVATYIVASDSLAAGTDMFAENEGLLLTLVSKNSASSSEHFASYAYSIENMLIVGENTAGCMLSSSAGAQMPNSNMLFCLPSVAATQAAGDFEELRGILPDLWCPASEAEEAALNFILRNVK